MRVQDFTMENEGIGWSYTMEMGYGFFGKKLGIVIIG